VAGHSCENGNDGSRFSTAEAARSHQKSARRAAAKPAAEDGNGSTLPRADKAAVSLMRRRDAAVR